MTLLLSLLPTFQHHETVMTLDQCGDVATARARNKITFPVARYFAILDFCWAFTDRYSIIEFT